MKKQTTLFTLIVVLLSLLWSTAIYGDETKAPGFKPQRFNIDGIPYDAYILKVDMKDSRNYVDVGLAHGKIGATQDLLEIANTAERESKEDRVIGAINGTFFNMSVNTSPINTILKDGKLKYAGTWASLATFDGDNEMRVTRPVFKIMGSINDQWDFPYGFTAKTVNKFPHEQYGVSVIDESFDGDMPEGKKYVVAVQDKKVIGIYDDMVPVPKNGFLLVSRVRFTLTDIHVGDSVDLQYKTFNIEDQSELLSFYNVRTALGAGPTLVLNGEIQLDLEREGFEGWSIYNDRQRSMIGMTKDKVLYLVVSDSISLQALAKLAVQLGLDTAMNLDGGGSAGLVIGNKYAFSPDRNVSNALIVKQRKEAPIRININQVEHFFDTEPYFYKDRTMVPLRGILEALGCTLEWNADTEEIIVTRYGKQLIFKSNSTLVKGEKRDYQMDVPLIIKNGRSAISIRFLTEFLGGNVSWDAEKNLVNISVDNAKEFYEIARQLHLSGKYGEALQYYDNTLKLNKDHIAALKYSGEIYKNNIKDYREAAKFLSRMLELYDDKFVSLSLLECYLHADNTEAALNLIQKLDDKGYDDLDFLITAARIFKNINKNKALDYYAKALEHKDITSDLSYEANMFIKSIKP